MEGFKIICKECEKEIEFKGNLRYETVKEKGFSFFATTNSTVVIECECGNTLWVG